MRPRAMRGWRGCLLAGLLCPWTASAGEPAVDGPARATPAAPAVSQAAMAEYPRKLQEYLRARRAYEAEAAAYWNRIAEKRRARNGKRRNHQAISIDDYVLTQPPLYSGPARPVDPSGREVPPPREYVPVVTDFLKSAAEHFNFVPQRPQSEIEYKRGYAKAASQAGLTKQQVVRIYAFESGGNGGYDVQAGLEHQTPGARAINTALGYNQLLNTNSVELMAEHGDEFIKILKSRVAGSAGEARKMLESKLEVVQRMVQFARTVPDEWAEHDKLANTPKGLGVHAMNLDRDVGPLLQVQKLSNSVVFARTRGYKAALTAAELEMMNLTGDGNGLDMIMMPPDMREKVPTSNFFQQGGYGRNPVAIRNNVVSKLLAATDAKMDQEEKLRGARDLAAAFSHEFRLIGVQ